VLQSVDYNNAAIGRRAAFMLLPLASELEAHAGSQFVLRRESVGL
jgi:hypothetical protein